jgi:hypothetical protein
LLLQVVHLPVKAVFYAAVTPLLRYIAHMLLSAFHLMCLVAVSGGAPA